MLQTVLLLIFARTILGLSYWVNETSARTRAVDTPAEYVGYGHENEIGCGEEWCHPSIKDPIVSVKNWLPVRVSRLDQGGNGANVKKELWTNGDCALKQFHSAKYPLSDPVPLVEMSWHIWDSFVQSVPLNSARHNLLCMQLIEIRNTNGKIVTARIAGRNAPPEGVKDSFQDKSIRVSSDVWVKLG